MNIAIDARLVEKPASRYRGMGLYTKRLCDALLKRNRSLARPHTFTIIASNPLHLWNGEVSVRRVPVVRKPSRLQWVLDGWALPHALRRDEIEVFHATELTSIPVCKGTKVIAHIYDMIPFLFWKEYSPRLPLDYRWALKLARERLEQAACIVTISQHSKRDIIELTGYPEKQIYVAYPGGPDNGDYVDSSMGPSRGVSRRTLPGGEGPYFLYVGGTDFRKNVPFLIRGFARFAE